MSVKPIEYHEGVLLGVCDDMDSVLKSKSNLHAEMRRLGLDDSLETLYGIYLDAEVPKLQAKASVLRDQIDRAKRENRAGFDAKRFNKSKTVARCA